MEMKHHLFDINEVQWEQTAPGVRTCVFKASDRGCVQYWEIEPGHGAVPHSHPAEQITYIQSGVMRLFIEDKYYDLTAGCWGLIPANAKHRTLNIGNSTFINIDIFVPDRPDRTESPKIVDLGHHWGEGETPEGFLDEK